MDINGNTKKLLIKDLLCRLPYGIKASYYGAEEECETWDEIEGITLDGYVDIGQYSLPIECIKPYLFPLSSITEGQKEELRLEHEKDIKTMANCLKKCSEGDTSLRGKNILYHAVDWCNKNHFDYRGLIPMGLALDATNLNIY